MKPSILTFEQAIDRCERLLAAIEESRDNIAHYLNQTVDKMDEHGVEPGSDYEMDLAEYFDSLLENLGAAAEALEDIDGEF